jgi:hypothetical protein
MWLFGFGNPYSEGWTKGGRVKCVLKLCWN